MQTHPAPDVDRSTAVRWLAAAALGAVLGSTARWAVGRFLFPGPVGVVSRDALDRAWPWATLVVNVIGCAAIGWCAVRLEQGTVRWHFGVTGVLGGFTTMSAVAVEVNRFADAGLNGRVVLYLSVTLAAGWIALLGAQTGARRRERRR